MEVLKCWSVGLWGCWSVGGLKCPSVGVLKCPSVGVFLPIEAIYVGPLTVKIKHHIFCNLMKL